MTTSKPPSIRQTSDYDAIEAALLESVRGRWFLAEFARRNRTADTQILLGAISRLESSLVAPRPVANTDLIRRDLIEMSEAISRTRQEIAALKPPDQDESHLITATEELDAIVTATETATSDILQSAEEIQEVAWLLRETGEHVDVCDKLDQRATDIYMACSFQDITGQRTEKVVAALRFLEARINSMMEIWKLDGVAPSNQLALADGRPGERRDAHLLNGPQLAGAGLVQDDIDGMIRAAEDDIEVIVAEPLLEVHPGTAPSGEAMTLTPEPVTTDDDEAAAPDDMKFEAVGEPEQINEVDTGAPEAGLRLEIDPAPAAPELDEAGDVHPDPVPIEAPDTGVVAANQFAVPEETGLEDLDWDKRNALFS